MGTQLLRHDAAGAAQARRCVGEALREARVRSDSVDDVLLVISELVTNALVHTGTEHLGVGWQLREADVTVCVDDADPTPPAPRVAARSDLSGRGLAIVAAIATDWGVHPRSAGKRVWATIPVRRG